MRIRRTLPLVFAVLIVASAVVLAVQLRKHAPPEPARLLPGADAPGTSDRPHSGLSSGLVEPRFGGPAAACVQTSSRIGSAVGSNSRPSSVMLRPARANSMIRCR